MNSTKCYAKKSTVRKLRMRVVLIFNPESKYMTHESERYGQKRVKSDRPIEREYIFRLMNMYRNVATQYTPIRYDPNSRRTLAHLKWLGDRSCWFRPFTLPLSLSHSLADNMRQKVIYIKSRNPKTISGRQYILYTYMYTIYTYQAINGQPE